MSTSDQQGNQPLTRKQLREIRLTGATPVITEEEAAAAAPRTVDPPRPIPVEPAQNVPAPRPDADVDLSETPLTRRQVREQERIRTSSVPVIDPTAGADAEATDEVVSEPEPDVIAEPEPDQDPAPQDDAPQNDDDRPDEEPTSADERPVVSPTFGTGLLHEQADVPTFTPSFDELITSDSGGSQHNASSTLIFNPSPHNGSLSGPVASTGEILITGSYDLPRGIGSQGHAHGTADGREADAVLIDGELPPSSSPTPIAASSAVSTIKPAGEVIRPPAPEKGNKLMLTLAITAGGLALALAVVLIVAFSMNVF